MFLFGIRGIQVRCPGVSNLWWENLHQGDFLCTDFSISPPFVWPELFIFGIYFVVSAGHTFREASFTIKSLVRLNYYKEVQRLRNDENVLTLHIPPANNAWIRFCYEMYPRVKTNVTFGDHNGYVCPRVQQSGVGPSVPFGWSSLLWTAFDTGK